VARSSIEGDRVDFPTALEGIDDFGKGGSGEGTRTRSRARGRETPVDRRVPGGEIGIVPLPVLHPPRIPGDLGHLPTGDPDDIGADGLHTFDPDPTLALGDDRAAEVSAAIGDESGKVGRRELVAIGSGPGVESSADGILGPPILESNHIEFEIVPAPAVVESLCQLAGRRPRLPLNLRIPSDLLPQPPSSHERTDDTLLDRQRVVVEGGEKPLEAKRLTAGGANAKQLALQRGVVEMTAEPSGQAVDLASDIVGAFRPDRRRVEEPEGLLGTVSKPVANPLHGFESGGPVDTGLGTSGFEPRFPGYRIPRRCQGRRCDKKEYGEADADDSIHQHLHRFPRRPRVGSTGSGRLPAIL